MNRKKLLLLIAAISSTITAFSQDAIRSSSSQFLPAFQKPDVSISFATSAEGKRYTPTWGLDQAWISEQNLRKGVNHMGSENIGIGRSAFRYTEELVNDKDLTSGIIATMKERNRIFDIFSKTLPIVFTADQEAVSPNTETGVTGPPTYYVKSNSANNDHWAAMIDAHVRWMQSNTKHPVAGISPFNEGDYWTKEEGATTVKQYQIAKLLKENYSSCANIPMVGGNTLNNDKALTWYSSGKNYYDWGNTHQLAGSFDNFAAFYQQLAADGKVGYADEMHNVGEAMIGLQYGMTVGIWWGFDSRARGEFCDISRNGVRLAYGEHRNNWTAASVYRHNDGRVKAFIGSSERQAYTTNYQFVSTERDVYYDGYGPVREFVMEMPGGTGYQTGQTNAERVINVTWGEDVQPSVINGTYKIVNKATGNLLSVNGSTIVMQKEKNAKTQQWNVAPISSRIGGDYSFYNIESVSDAKLHINVQDFSTQEGANILAYKVNEVPTSNEQWYIEYAGNGYFYIRNRESALYLVGKSSLTINNVGVTQKKQGSDPEADRYLWRFLPAELTYETTAPAQPSGLGAEAHTASVSLWWNANTEKDLEGYMVLRAPKGTNDWNTIARKVTTNYFTDNSCRQGVSYIYKVKAIDLSQNLSAASEEVETMPTGEPSLIARWAFNGTLNDDTPNMMDAVCSAAPTYADKDDAKAVSLASNRYLQLPYEVANSDELTIGMWVYWNGSGNWTRIFDFGYDTDHYLFLTPSNGSIMRFAIKNGGNEQTVDCNAKLTSKAWKHVVVSIGNGKTTIYVDGVEAGSSTGITIRPSDVKPVLNYLGRSQFVADPYFTGSLSDVRIYNYAVSADEVQSMMRGELPTGVQQLSGAEAQQKPNVYGLDGVKRSGLRQGMNIVRSSNGRSNSRKVIVK